MDVEIDNEHSKNPIKGGTVRLIMVVRFRCKGSEKFTNVTLSYFTLPTIPQCSIIEFQHCLQIPDNAFPTYSQPNALINSSYHISVMLNEYTPIEIPIIIGTEISTQSPLDIQNKPSSLLAITGYIKIRPFPKTLPQQTFPPLINPSQFLPLSQLLHSSSLSHSLPISSHHLHPNFDKQLNRSSSYYVPLYTTPFPFSHTNLNYHHHSEAIFFPEEFPVTRYNGQSVLRIEEIE
ncbi:hypothetical protein LOAG_02379 [Loa loa]|uniref:Arrestin C-terminal-like domain-containing protein n=1 Tax=Loa loa TaxID=7209 RepID=A0A1S0U7C4_LOALO|nr:hypothetical protein LOAG_02379 [Loa loa]EFO26111.1 hypothetical protein LOAG_02379 [Loa loa]